jgi:ribosomal-protein-alanine N-acetyltransferase
MYHETKRTSTAPRCPQQPVHVRWMIHRDLPEVLRIENALFCDQAWTEEEFVRVLRLRYCIGMVAETKPIKNGVRDGDIVSYMIYELHRTRLHLLNFAVDPGYQRRGVGRQMVAKLQAKLSNRRRQRIMAEVRETNVDAQLFFRAMKFRCITTLKGCYEERNVSDDAYLFQYRVPIGQVSNAVDDGEDD